jgi:hypothetical protein
MSIVLGLVRNGGSVQYLIKKTATGFVYRINILATITGALFCVFFFFFIAFFFLFFFFFFFFSFLKKKTFSFRVYLSLQCVTKHLKKKLFKLILFVCMLESHPYIDHFQGYIACFHHGTIAL